MENVKLLAEKKRDALQLDDGVYIFEWAFFLFGFALI